MVTNKLDYIFNFNSYHDSMYVRECLLEVENRTVKKLLNPAFLEMRNDKQIKLLRELHLNTCYKALNFVETTLNRCQEVFIKPEKKFGYSLHLKLDAMIRKNEAWTIDNICEQIEARLALATEFNYQIKTLKHSFEVDTFLLGDCNWWDKHYCCVKISDSGFLQHIINYTESNSRIPIFSEIHKRGSDVSSYFGNERAIRCGISAVINCLSTMNSHASLLCHPSDSYLIMILFSEYLTSRNDISWK